MLLFSETTGPEGAPVLLMGSSLGTTMDMWDSQLALAERLRIVRFDHRGHGRSPVPSGPYEIADLGRDVLELMDSLEIERASYCGLSIGGMVGMWLGANAPERIERLVLCLHLRAPAARRGLGGARGEGARGGHGRGRRRRGGGALAHARLRRASIRSSWPSCARCWSPPIPTGYAEGCGAIERMDLRDQLGRDHGADAGHLRRRRRGDAARAPAADRRLDPGRAARDRRARPPTSPRSSGPRASTS